VNILALESAGHGCSVALLAGERLVERLEEAPRRHAATLLPMAEECLAEAGIVLRELDAVAFGRGPGSFTGVRIATGVAQGIAFAAGLAVVPVSNLAACAAAALRLRGWREVLVALDARMGEVYTGAFSSAADGPPTAVGVERLCAPDAVAAPGAGRWQGAGSAFAAYPALAARLGLGDADATVAPLARDLLGLATAALARGEAVAAEDALPVHLRDQVAWQGGGRQT
jgi:tRNA threonylcarbamoyladenosine biosynthesis protein TsaB